MLLVFKSFRKKYILKSLRIKFSGVSIVAQQVKNLISTHEDMGSVPSLAQWVRDLVLPQAAL